MRDSNTSKPDQVEDQILELEKRQVELLARLEACVSGLNSAPIAAADSTEARLRHLEQLTQRLAHQTAITHARVEEIVASRTWRLLTRAGGILMRIVGGGTRR